MDKYTYLHRSLRNIPFEVEEALDDSLFPQGDSYIDYESGRWIQLNDAQVSFAELYPAASALEKINMLTPERPVDSMADIESVRDNAINTIVREADAKIRELYPSYDVLENLSRAVLSDDNTEARSYLESFLGVKKEADASVSLVRERIDASVEARVITDMVSQYRNFDIAEAFERNMNIDGDTSTEDHRGGFFIEDTGSAGDELPNDEVIELPFRDDEVIVVDNGWEIDVIDSRILNKA